MSDIGENYTFADVILAEIPHIAISLLFGFVIYFGYRKHLKRVFQIALIVMFMDIDHFAPFRDIDDGVFIFHNLLVALIIPALVMALCVRGDRRTHNYDRTFMASLFLVMLTGHVFYDSMDNTPTLLFYPFSTDVFWLSDLFSELSFVNSDIHLKVVSALYYVVLTVLYFYFLRVLGRLEHKSDELRPGIVMLKGARIGEENRTGDEIGDGGRTGLPVLPGNKGMKLNGTAAKRPGSKRVE